MLGFLGRLLVKTRSKKEKINPPAHSKCQERQHACYKQSTIYFIVYHKIDRNKKPVIDKFNQTANQGRMKIAPNILKIFPAGILGAVLALISATSAQAQILLNINTTDSSAVVITASGTFTGTGISQDTLNDGVTLEGFFTGALADFYPFTVDPSSNLTTGTATAGVFDQAVADIASGSIVDLTLYSSTDSESLSFVNGVDGFKGTLTLNLSGVSGSLPSSGSGNIVTGFSGNFPDNTTIGTFVINAPEPSTYLLVLGGLGLVIFARRTLRRS